VINVIIDGFSDLTDCCQEVVYLLILYLCKKPPMENLINRISSNPDVCNGKPVIRGLRISVSTILEYLAAGETPENILAAKNVFLF